MAEDRPEEVELPPDPGRAKRAPPTIDLEATEISGESRSAGAEAEPGADAGASANPEPEPSVQRRPMMSSAIISAVTGACAAALVIVAAWQMGWLGQAAPPPAPAVSQAVIDGIASRLAAVESRADKPASPAPDPAAAAHVDALQKSVASLSSDLAALRAQSEKLAADVNNIKSAPRDAAATPDLSAINERIAGLERAARAQTTEIAQENAKPVDDVALRRIVAASLLDVLVRTGEPYPAALSAAKSLAPNPDTLKPLDAFAASGVPSVARAQPRTAGAGAKTVAAAGKFHHRLHAGRQAAGERVQTRSHRAHGRGRQRPAATWSRASPPPHLRNDYKEARRELETLPASDRAAAQAWLEKADARDAALAVSRQFASEAMTALAKPAP